MNLPIIKEEECWLWKCVDCEVIFTIKHPLIHFEHGKLQPVSFFHWGSKKDKPGCPHCLKRNTFLIEDINTLKPED
jgi:hypothetical protein